MQIVHSVLFKWWQVAGLSSVGYSMDRASCISGSRCKYTSVITQPWESQWI